MRAIALYCCIALVAVTACKKTVEGESKRWTSANRTVDELAVLYPSFKSALEEQRAKAKKAMDAAKAVSDEKQRIDKMSAANSLLTSGFVGQLRDADRTIKDIRKKLIDVSGKATDEADRLSARQAAQQAERVLAEVEARLQSGAPDAAAAAVIMKRVTADLRAAKSNIDRVARNARAKERAKKKAQQPKAGQGAKTPAKTKTPAGSKKKAAETWTCEYCDTSNPANNATCHNCGAARPHK